MEKVIANYVLPNQYFTFIFNFKDREREKRDGRKSAEREVGVREGEREKWV